MATVKAVARIASRTSCDIVWIRVAFSAPMSSRLACRDVGKALSAKRGRDVHRCSLERSCQELGSECQATNLLNFHEACVTLHFKSDFHIPYVYK